MVHFYDFTHSSNLFNQIQNSWLFWKRHFENVKICAMRNTNALAHVLLQNFTLIWSLLRLAPTRRMFFFLVLWQEKNLSYFKLFRANSKKRKKIWKKIHCCNRILNFCFSHKNRKINTNKNGNARLTFTKVWRSFERY